MASLIASPANGVAPRAVRRQYQSCDTCRQKRKACDAGRLGILDDALNEQHARRPSCSPCLKYGRSCTFSWLAQQSRQARTLPRHARPSTGSTRYRPKDPFKTPRDQAPFLDPLWTLELSQDDAAGVTFPPGWQDEVFHGLYAATDVAASYSIPQESSPSSGMLPTSGATQSVLCSPSLSQTLFTPHDLSQSTDDLFDPSISGNQGDVHHRAASFHHADDALAMGTQKTGITNILVSIYRNHLEHALSCWSTAINCPYNNPAQTARGQSNQMALLYRCTSYYERARRLDRAVLSLGLKSHPPISSGQSELAAQVLHKVILAFSSQWSSTDHATSAGARSPSTADPLSLHLLSTLQKTLWHDAKLALHAAAGIASFQVAFAQLIFSFIRSPLDDQAMPGRRHSSVSSQQGRHDTNTSEESDPCLEVLRLDEPPTHLENALRQLLHWRRWLYSELRRNAQGSASLNLKQKTFLNEFNMLFWLAVMCDTTSSAVNGRSIVISDEDTAIENIGPSRTTHATLTSPGIGEIPGSQQTEKPVPLWNERILDRSAAADEACHNWPLPESEVERILQEAIPTKVLLFRRVANLQTLVHQNASNHRIENAIQDALIVYQHWQAKYADFMSNCTQRCSHLSPSVRSWHVILAVHWHYGAILLAEAIDRIDGAWSSDERRRSKRQSLYSPTALALENSVAITRLAVGCSLVRDTSTWHDSPQDDGADAMMSEPWCEIMIRSLSKAAATILAACSNGATAEQCLWLEEHGLDAAELRHGVQGCIAVLRELSRRCQSAELVAAALDRRLSTLSLFASY
ncbi:hypothetical protein BDY17DRAFT_312822 [Neohortaea acidophila]|uniref:Zn(2)-C6 fungal-type domain-containing protein n=1 Tax=Neohortaea acidophila TaxID=245834 RepID=A0A6A6PIM4_9PEZI|nr:uncharacterized protein BDY17DRAFT_312822 [Neohortaea acidophila]KAF2479890.1 hypothetical protein BDY17DRAFT_312822 [Neohortaea acidophila]